MISNSGHDERGQYSGGQAGDQGGEWSNISWYSRPWNCVLRYPEAAVRECIASLAEKAAENDMIGYDQGERYSYWYALQAADYDPSEIKTPCEADCSAGVIANVKAAGYICNVKELADIKATYTGNMRTELQKAGFAVLTDQKYLNSPDYLMRGDILLNDEYHTATNLTNGKYVTDESGEYDATLAVPLHTWYGTESGNPYPLLKSVPYVDTGVSCKVIQEYIFDGERWCKVQCKGIVGFCRAENVVKH